MEPEIHNHTLPLADRVAMIRHAAKCGNDFIRHNTVIENDQDGFTGYRWEKFNVPLHIVCAANIYGDFIVAGTRHYSPTMFFTLDLIGKDALMEYAKEFSPTGDADDGIAYRQGFIDQYGNFHDRIPAMKLCLDQGRKLSERGGPIGYGNRLYSEHLY